MNGITVMWPSRPRMSPVATRLASMDSSTSPEAGRSTSACNPIQRNSIKPIDAFPQTAVVIREVFKTGPGGEGQGLKPELQGPSLNTKCVVKMTMDQVGSAFQALLFISYACP